MSTRPQGLLHCDGLAIGFGRKLVASGIDLTFRSGERWGVIGPNGAGKTTLIRTLMGVLDPLAGTVMRRPGLRFGYVKQRHALHDLYPFTVFETVMMGRFGRIAPLRRPRASDRAAVEQALERTGTLPLRNTPVSELSGGQKQRVLIARALCSEPDVIVLDEPTNDMDIAGEESVLGLILDVHAHTGAAVIMISHLLHAVLKVADNLIFIDGRTVGIFSREEFVRGNHLERFYGIPIHVIPLPGGGYTVTAAGGGGE